MPRSLYPTIFCSTLVLLGAILLRPGLGQELVNFANQVRAQAPDPAYGQGIDPGIDPRVRAQFENIPQAPMQPIPLRYPTAPSDGRTPAGNSPYGQGRPIAGAGPIRNLDSALIVARVGADTILASDFLGKYAAYAKAQAEGAPDSVLAPVRAELLDEIRGMADSKILFAEASKTIPAEGLKDIEKKLNDEFYKSQVTAMMERAKCKTKEELDAKLHEVGTSLERRRRVFFENNVAKMWLQQNVKEEEIPYADIFAYYQNNGTKFDHQARARWEELTVDFDKFGSKPEARAALCNMGNDVLRGVPFAEVAKAHSQGPTASSGGQRDWTTQGSLKSTVLDAALFGLPVMRMSRILEDDEGYHIVARDRAERCLSHSVSRSPSRDSQAAQAGAIQAEIRGLSDEAAQENPIWTIFDSQGPAVAAGPNGIRRN